MALLAVRPAFCLALACLLPAAAQAGQAPSAASHGASAAVSHTLQPHARPELKGPIARPVKPAPHRASPEVARGSPAPSLPAAAANRPRPAVAIAATARLPARPTLPPSHNPVKPVAIAIPSAPHSIAPPRPASLGGPAPSRPVGLDGATVRHRF
jgi:hypothetical protein